jgi:hypothetical protein
MSKASIYTEILRRFENQPIVTLCTGTTCGCLGDERNLREFLFADEIAKRLQNAGHTVFSLLMDDSLDPLTDRQLRIAVNKDAALMEQYQDWCGKPIGLLPDPWGCHSSYAAHFEQALRERLHRLNCHPTVVSTSTLYERGVYAPYVQITLERYEEILQFLSVHFQGYQPEKLFYPLCPDCGYIDETSVTSVKTGNVVFACERCERCHKMPIQEVRGKLNWKLDCAARWAIFRVDAEPFTKAYLEPKTGTVAVAQALGQAFFGGKEILPLPYGMVKMDRTLSYKLLESLPGDVLRHLLVTNPSADLNLTAETVLTAASRHKVAGNLSYLETIKQLLPMWLLSPDVLSPAERNLLMHGTHFARHFLNCELRLTFPSREHLAGTPMETLQALHTVTKHALTLRHEGHSSETFTVRMREQISELGEQKREVLHQFRQLVGQEQGLPVPRMLALLPLEYLSLLEYLLELCTAPTPATRKPFLRLAA